MRLSNVDNLTKNSTSISCAVTSITPNLTRTSDNDSTSLVFPAESIPLEGIGQCKMILLLFQIKKLIPLEEIALVSIYIDTIML